MPRLRRFLSALVTDLRTRSVDDRDNVMSELEQLLLLSSLREPRRFMNWDEVREMAAAGVEFGAHTLTHANLVLCGADEADVEIRGSKAIIEHALTQACPLFAYTYGKNTPTVHELVERAGFTAAFTINPGLIRKGADPLRLNRIDIYENVAPNLPFFACRALHLFQVY